MRTAIPDDEYLLSGHLACPGCGEQMGLRMALKALGPKTIMVVPAGCAAVVAGLFPYSATKIPFLHCAFDATASTAAGVKAGLDALGDRETQVLGWAGDGATFDIGLQALSSVAERNEDIIYCCYDNEAYMNTGIQRSSATPYGAWTTTTPVVNPKDRPKKRMAEIMADHQIPYVATASVAYAEDLVAKFEKAKERRGTRFIHLFAPCPTGWKSLPEHTVRLARLAVETCLFPLYEVFEGDNWIMNVEPLDKKPLAQYLALQGRFSHLEHKEVELLQQVVDRDWERLRRRCSG